MWIAPREHAPHFSRLSPHRLPEFAQLFRRLLVKLEAIVKLSACNYIVHTAPFDIDSDNHYHWHIEILPRITTLAGFELGTGCYINPLAPEQAAAVLREA
jgi:UDPglucose--hexose-1-phosphate uridylyltransferase